MSNIFNKLVQAEKDFQKSEFVAPIFSDQVAVNIAGITSTYKVKPYNYNGWAILRPEPNKVARVHSEAPRKVIKKYLETLPRFTFVVCDIDQELGIVTSSDNRIPIRQPFKIYLLKNISIFDEVYVRFTGSHFIYERHNNGPKSSIVENWEKELTPDQLKLPSGWKEAYEYVYYKKQKELIGNKEYQIKSAIEKAGGNYISYSNLENKDVQVSFEVNGQTVSATLGENLDVVCAGFCLSGGDVEFDLQSLVSVAMEGRTLTMGDWRGHYGRL